MKRMVVVLLVVFPSIIGCTSREEREREGAIEATRAARAAMNAEDYDAALNHIQEAVRLQPTGDRYRTMAEIHLLRRDFHKALEALEKGIQLSPHDQRIIKLKTQVEDIKAKGKLPPTS